MTISSLDEAERHLDRAWYAALVTATIDGVLGAMAILGTRSFTLFVYLYARGVQGAFAYHRLLAAGPAPLATSRKASA